MEENVFHGRSLRQSSHVEIEAFLFDVTRESSELLLQNCQVVDLIEGNEQEVIFLHNYRGKLILKNG